MNINSLSLHLLDENAKIITIENKTIDINYLTIRNDDIYRNINIIIFTNCRFKGVELNFEEINKLNLSIYFKECRFECDLKVLNSNLNHLKFIDTIDISKTLEISGNKINAFYLKNSKKKTINKLKANIKIHKNIFYKFISLEFTQHTWGEFLFTNNDLKNKIDKGIFATSGNFRNAQFHNAVFSETNFGEEVRFDYSVFSSNISLGRANFHNCIFENAYFDFVHFREPANFNGSTFKSYTQFLRSKNINNGQCFFTACTFHDYFNFNGSEFKNLIIKNSIFRGAASFIDTKFNQLKIHQTQFEKSAYFDNVEILNINKCDRNTLRSIKQELQKSQNIIDYNNFKSYELDAYKRELVSSNKKDLFILWLNSISSRHGLDWFRSINFTLIIGFIFYCLYFTSENHNLNFSFSYNSINNFLLNYFKFLIPTYSTTFENGLSKWYQQLLFIIGKIFISYGIFQTIQSFRKFRI